MRTIVHLSDLHFGRVDTALLDPLVAAVAAAQPDVVAISGDFTQRARTAQFMQARAFLDRLPRPQIVVPGNHDVPLYDVLRRFAAPLHRYRRYISDDLSPVFRDGQIAVIGLNTARSLTFKGGRINVEQAGLVARQFAQLDDTILRVVVTHHPFDLPKHDAGQDVVGGARMAMKVFADCGVDLLLSGHLHHAHAGDSAARYEIPGFAALVVQAGTATSTRSRGEPNAFNVIRAGTARIEVDVHAWEPGRSAFGVWRTDAFERRGGVWMRAQPD